MYLLDSSGCSPGDANDMDSIIESVKDIEITPVRIREFLPKVNWDRLASMYVAGRTGGECESRYVFLNC
jgi:myb proto-oncogene protein